MNRFRVTAFLEASTVEKSDACYSIDGALNVALAFRQREDVDEVLVQDADDTKMFHWTRQGRTWRQAD